MELRLRGVKILPDQIGAQLGVEHNFLTPKPDAFCKTSELPNYFRRQVSLGGENYF